MCKQDPIDSLPPEIVLRILDFVPVSGIAAVTRLSHSWNKFIEKIHQDAIYSHPAKTNPLTETKNLSSACEGSSFVRYWESLESWKDLCKRQTLLRRNWNAERPVTRESVVQVGNSPVWRFRPDFKRRILLSTSQLGGLNVTDMDSGRLLWCLSAEDVRPYAHLEYQDGTAVWDSEGDSLVVWKTDLEGLRRGAFKQVAAVAHDCQTRGFQLSFNNLCVVSNQGKGSVYDMLHEQPMLMTRLEIENDAVGHLAQNEDVVMYSMGGRGYHFHDKSTGAFLGSLQPWLAQTFYHINHPPRVPPSYATTARHGPTEPCFPPGAPRTDRMESIDIVEGPFRRREDVQQGSLEMDEWGAGLLSGNLMVGISRGGRVFVCPHWRASLRNADVMKSCSYLIEVESNRDDFDLGGWLSIKDNRIMFEVQERLYVIALDEEGRVQTQRPPKRALYACLTSSAPQVGVPVSFVCRYCYDMMLMALFDDCIMTTYTTLGRRQRDETQGEAQQGARDLRSFAFPTKAIRVISFAPANEEMNESAPRLWQTPARAQRTQQLEARGAEYAPADPT